MKIDLLISSHDESDCRLGPVEPIGPDNSLWRRWWLAHKSERIDVETVAAIKGIKNPIHVARLRLRLVKTSAAKERLDLGGGVHGYLKRIGFRRFSIKVISPFKGRMTFSPDRFAFISQGDLSL